MDVLTGTVFRVDALSSNLVNHLFSLLTEVFEDKDHDSFIEDLNEKDYVILLYLTDSETEDNSIRSLNDIKGFSTQKVIYTTYQNTDYGIVFSGDTVILKEYWGTPELSRIWTHLAFALRNNEPNLQWYWFLISSGYRTYRYMPVFFLEYYPNVKKETPQETQDFMDFLALSRYPDYYIQETGIVRFPHTKERVKSGISDVTDKELRNKHIRFFVEKNPGYVKGDELVCLTQIHPKNFNPKRISWTTTRLEDIVYEGMD